jgi:hypothetical protein
MVRRPIRPYRHSGSWGQGGTVTLNEAFGWTWILVGLFAGLGLGLGFHQDGWLGGYTSFPRRLIRLAHVSLVGLGFLNVLFGMNAGRFQLSPGMIPLASWSLMVGGMSMPACCILAAWRPGLRQLFAVPVVSLFLGVGLAVWGTWQR